jgi:hypothetical protein
MSLAPGLPPGAEGGMLRQVLLYVSGETIGCLFDLSITDDTSPKSRMDSFDSSHHNYFQILKVEEHIRRVVGHYSPLLIVCSSIVNAWM